MSTARGSAGVLLAKNHAGGLDGAYRRVDGEEFAGRSRREAVGVVHAEVVGLPVILIARKFGELVGAVR